MQKNRKKKVSKNLRKQKINAKKHAAKQKTKSHRLKKLKPKKRITIKVKTTKIKKPLAKKIVKKTAAKKPAIVAKKQFKSNLPVKANLLLTYDPAHFGSAKEEVENALKQLNKDFEFTKSAAPGTFLLKLHDARNALKGLRELCMQKPEFFNVTFHWTPIDSWCKAEISQMQEEIKKLLPSIGQMDKWKMQLNKRSHPKSFRELIVQLTEPVDRPNVDLKNPEKIICVEIIGDEAGISLATPFELIDIQKLKKH